MLHGILKTVDAEQMDKIHEAALSILEKAGMRLKSPLLLKALADAGCRVDLQKEQGWFRPELVEKQIAAQRDRYRQVRSSLWYPFCREIPKDDVAFPDEFTCDYGFGAPAIYDYRAGRARPATEQDQIDMIKLGNGLECARAVNAPFVCGDVDSRIEIVRSARLLLLHANKPGWVGTSCAKEVPFLAELAALAANGNAELLRTQPPIFVNAYCTTSPLKLDSRSCDVLTAALKYKYPVNFASMPIMGATTPITAAGSVAVAAAEILGCITATSLLAPDIYYFGTIISGVMDMQTMGIRYASPAAVLTDAAAYRLFHEKYGLVCNVEPAYIDAKHPGIQAACFKSFRQWGLGCTASQSLPLGLLDNGAVFSPTQAMLDLDMNKAIFQFSRGIEVNADTLAVDTILERGFSDQGSYLETEHTANHFRDIIWEPNTFERVGRGETGDQLRESADVALLRRADEVWRDIVAGQPDKENDPAFSAEVERITAAAEKELMKSP